MMSSRYNGDCWRRALCSTFESERVTGERQTTKKQIFSGFTFSDNYLAPEIPLLTEELADRLNGMLARFSDEDDR
jgi:hypothetical protein